MNASPLQTAGFLALFAALLLSGCGEQGRAVSQTNSTASGSTKAAPEAAAEQGPDSSETSNDPNPASADNTDPPQSQQNKDDAEDLLAVSDEPPAEPVKSPPRRSSGGLNNISFDDIKFEMEKNEDFKPSMITEKIEKLKGQKIRIRGYMHPAVFQNQGIKRFVLVRDNQKCCFGPGAMLYDCIIVEMAEGKTTNFKVLPFAVEGEFDIEPYKVGGRIFGLYRLRQANVQ